MKSENKFTEEVLNSLNDLKRSGPDEFLFQKIMTRMDSGDGGFVRDNMNSGKYILIFAFLMMLNIYSVINFHKTEKEKINSSKISYSSGLNEISKEYFSGNDDYNY